MEFLNKKLILFLCSSVAMRTHDAKAWCHIETS